MKPIREWGWTVEGFCFRRKDVTILKPKTVNGVWKVRKVNCQKGLPLEPGEIDQKTRKEAFISGNHLVKEMKKMPKLKK